MAELFLLPRSLTGDGVRRTLAVLGRDVPLELVETPTGTPVFDWTVPQEWIVRGAWIEGPDGRRVVDVADSPLHLLGYSRPVDAELDLEELRPHLFTHPDDPDAVPYRTSYWEEAWGFCLSRRQLDSLPPGRYRVVVDSSLVEGSLSSGETLIPGASEEEFLISTYICHPALANDNLSGVVMLWALARALARQSLRFTYRLLWSPGTLGPLCWLARNEGSARSRRPRARDLVRRRPRAAQVQAKPPRRGDGRQSGRPRPRRPAREHRLGLVAARGRRAPVLLTRLRPASGGLHAHTARPLR